MDTVLLEKHFAKVGARVRFREITRNWRERPGIDIGLDRRGEFFDIRLSPGEALDYEVADSRPDLRHLLLLARRGEAKEKYLCGHDERHWFVCAVPGKSVSGVLTAMRALQPPLVRWSVHVSLRRPKNLFRRRNEAFVRQGEWFFVPAPEVSVGGGRVLRNEPLSRGLGSKPHVCQYAHRSGGVTVMVCRYYPAGVSPAAYSKLLKEEPTAARWGWFPMTRDPLLYVRGSVRHPDHKTIVLDGWHRVAMNTEQKASYAPRVVFLD
jgi:hypothetical protein